MKKKGIALLCAFSLICANVSIFAENADNLQENEVLTEETGNELPKPEELDENIDSKDDEAFLEKGLMLLSENDVSEDEDNIPTVDKTELVDLLEAAVFFTEEVLGDGYSDFESAVAYAQSVADDEAATEDVVADAADALADAIDVAEKLVRNNLYELLLSAESVDKELVSADSYAAFEAAYNVARETYWNTGKSAEEIYSVQTELLDAIENLVHSTEIVILSGNIKTDEAKSYYPDMNSDDLPNITYKYLPGGNPGLLINDPSNNKLTQGLKSSAEVSDIVFGNWNQHQITEIVFDLGENVYISGVDVWECKKFNYCKLGLVEVHMSDNGTDYTLAGSTTQTNDGSVNALLKVPVEFTPVKGRFMKLRVRDANCNQLILNEVVIHGYRCSQGGDTPVYFENLDYKNDSDERIITLENENEVTISGKVVNNTSEEMPVKVITAAYADGALLDLDIKTENMTPFAKKDISMSVDLDGVDDAQVYTFVWDNVVDMNVLSPIEGFGLLKHKTASIAADGEGAAFDTESVSLTAWGTSAENTGLCDAALLVLKSGTLNTDTADMSDSELENAILYIEQARPDENGKYGFEFFPYDVSAMYGNNNVYVKEKTEETPNYYRLLFFDAAGEAEMLNAFCTANGADEMRSAIDTYDYVLAGIGLIDRAVEKYGEETVLASVSSMLTDAVFETSEDVVNEIIAAVVLTDINNLETKEEVIYAILEYADEMMIDDNGIYKNYYTGDDNKNYREDISDNFVGQSYASVSAFEYDLCETIILDIFNNVMNYTQVKNVISEAKEYLEELGFDYEEYEKLTPSKQKRVQQAMASAKGSYTDLDFVKEKFNDTVKDPGEDKTYGNSSFSGGGGSVSSGGGLPLTGVKTSDIEIFSDLDSVSWAKESILALYKKGIVSGMTETKFAPGENVTREQFAKMLVCAFGLYDAKAESEFEDIEEDTWYGSYVASAKNAGIINGISAKLFGVGANITRQDMAVMAYNTLHVKADKVMYDESQITEFTDDSAISDYARDAVYAMRGLGIMQGRGNNAFEAKAFATRAEAAKIIHALLGE